MVLCVHVGVVVVVFFLHIISFECLLVTLAALHHLICYVIFL